MLRRALPLLSFLCLLFTLPADSWAATAADYDNEVLADAPYAYYKFDDVSSATATDSSGNGRDMIGTGPITPLVPGAFPGSSAMRLTGGGFTASTWFPGAGGSTNNNFTIEAWAKPSTLSPAWNAVIVGAGGYSGGCWQGAFMGQDTVNSGSAWTELCSDYIASIHNTWPDTNTWVHLAFRRQSGVTTLWVNGVQVASAAGNLNLSAGRFTVGYMYNYADTVGMWGHFRGDVDNVAFYNKALPDARIETHALLFSPPVNASAPTLSGVVREGKTLTVSNGTWSGAGTINYTQQWQRETSPGVWQDIAGATGSSYTLTASDAGAQVRAQVTATNTGGSSTATSSPSGTVLTAAPSSGDNYDQLVQQDNPYAYYPFDDIDPNAAGADASGNGHDLTRAGSVTTGVPGAVSGSNAVRLTGGGFTAATWFPGAAGSSSNNFTIEAWAKPSTLNPGLNAVAVGDGGYSGGCWQGAFLGQGAANQGSAWNELCSDSTASTNNAWPDTNTWVHLAFRRQSGVTALFVNGAKVATATGNVNLSAGRFTVGYMYNYADTVGLWGHFRGDVDNVAYYDHPLTDERIYTHAINLPANSPPVNITQPKLSGIPRQGRQLNSTSGTWIGAPTITYTYQWQRDTGSGWQNISGATSQSYTAGAADAGASVRLHVTAANPYGTTTANTDTITIPAIDVADTYDSHVLADGPYAYYPLDDLQGTTATDASGHGHDLTDLGVGALTFRQSGAMPGSQAVAFNGASLWHNGPFPGQGGSFNDNFTVEAWAKPTTSTGSHPFVSNGYYNGSCASGTYLVQTNAAAQSVVGSCGDEILDAPNTFADTSAYHYVVFRRAAGINTLWIDGVKIATGSVTAVNNPGSAQFSIGNMPGVAKFFDGDVDNVAWYDKPLSDQRIADHFAAAQPPTTPVADTDPTISGTAREGQTLTADPGSWSGGLITFTYQWQRDTGSGWQNISGATSQSYTLTAADIDAHVRVLVTGTNPAGAVNKPSADVGPVLAKAPVNTTPPQITGVAEIGATLTADDGAWTSSVPVSYSYQWQRETSPGVWANITSATISTYTLTAADESQRVRVQVTATNAGGSASAFSAATVAVAQAPPVNTVRPQISGTPKHFQTLTTDNGTWTGTAPLNFTYQWQRETSPGVWTDIAAATGSSYTAQTADIGYKLRVQVTASNAAASDQAVSAPVGPVTAAMPSNLTAPGISGTSAEGHTLVAAPGDWQGTDPIAYAFQWQRETSPGVWENITTDGSDITYTTTEADAEKRLRVKVIASNAAGEDVAYSTPTPAVNPNSPNNVVPPTLDGAFKDGETLHINVGTWTGGARKVKIVWIRCHKHGNPCTIVQEGGALDYTLGPNDADHKLKVQVTMTNSSGSQTVELPLTDTVAAQQPVQVRKPGPLTGSPAQGGSLTADSGQWSGTNLNTSYQWQRETSPGVWENIPGATDKTYQPGAADAGKRVRTVITVSNAQLEGGEETIYITEPCPVPAEKPKVTTGGVTNPDGSTTVVPGQPITVDPGTWPDGVTVSIGWQRQDGNGVWKTIDGAAGNTYTPSDADRVIRPVIITIDGEGNRRIMELDPIQITDALIIADVHMTPRPLLASNANMYKKAAMNRHCARIHDRKQRDACRVRVEERFRVRLRWKQNASSQVRYEFVRGEKVLGGATINGVAGDNEVRLSKRLAAALDKVDWYQVRFSVDASVKRKLRFTVRPSVQLIHAPYRHGRRVLAWWQDRAGTVTVTIHDGKKVLGRLHLNGHRGSNISPFPEKVLRGMRHPGRYHTEAEFRVGKLRSWRSRTYMNVRPHLAAVRVADGGLSWTQDGAGQLRVSVLSARRTLASVQLVARHGANRRPLPAALRRALARGDRVRAVAVVDRVRSRTVTLPLG